MAKLRRRRVTQKNFLKRSSKYRGVTKHSSTHRFEAHLWDNSCWNVKQQKKGRQVYVGAYDDEEAAARAYDLAALKYWGARAVINFPLSDYERHVVEMANSSRRDYLVSLRRKSSGFSRGLSKYRGVARHHSGGRWEARIGCLERNKYTYLGTFATQEEAAVAYDIAALENRRHAAVTNFDKCFYSQIPSADPGKPRFVFLGNLGTNCDDSEGLDYHIRAPVNQPQLLDPHHHNTSSDESSSTDMELVHEFSSMELGTLESWSTDGLDSAVLEAILSRPEGSSSSDLPKLEKTNACQIPCNADVSDTTTERKTEGFNDDDSCGATWLAAPKEEYNFSSFESVPDSVSEYLSAMLDELSPFCALMRSYCGEGLAERFSFLDILEELPPTIRPPFPFSPAFAPR